MIHWWIYPLLFIFKRWAFRRAFGVWCKHYSWTPWERVGDHGQQMRTCEGCGIRRMNR